MSNPAILEKKFFKLSALFLMAALIVFTIAGIFRHEYYSYIIYHNYPIAYLQNIMLFLCFTLACANVYLSYKKENKFSIVWVCLSAGFFYLALDASFHIHQLLREVFFKPNDVSIKQLFWVDKGDYVLLFLLAAGLVFMPFALKELRRNRRSMIFFIAAVVLSCAAVIADSFDLHQFGYGFQKFLQYVEEICESFAQICFLNSFFCSAVNKLYVERKTKEVL